MPTAFCDEENSLPPNSDPQRKQHMVPVVIVVTYRNLHVLIQMCKNCAKKKKTCPLYMYVVVLFVELGSVLSL